ncbi:MAG TPA: penicillin-binding protein [Candidatus Binatia bacterium]
MFAIVGLRAFQLQVLQGEKLTRLGNKQRIQEWTLLPKRGSILDRAGEPVAISLEAQSVYVRPSRIREPAVAAPQLAKALGVSAGEVGRKFKSGQPFVWLKRQVTPRQAERVGSLRLAGVGMYYEPKRYYPQGRLAGQMLGFVGRDSKGLEGVEAYYDRYIRGELGSSFVEQDALGRKVMIQGVERLEVPPGADIHLTLDASIQHLVEKQLEAAVTTSNAKAGIAIIVEPLTGEVLAMANYPFFDPNNFTQVPSKRWRNRAVTDIYEPGSTFKAILAAAAVEEGAVGNDELFYCEMGRYVFGGRVIHDEKPHGWLNLDGIIKVSSNIGATKIAERLGKERYYQYIKRFGFGRSTGIDLPGEARGLVRAPARWSGVDLATHAFGQGIAVTPIQLVMAYAAVANGGFLMRPFVVKRVVGPEGKVLLSHDSHVVRRVLTEQTARAVTSALRGAVSVEGTGAKAEIEGFQVAGKTGTSQKADLVHGGYSAEKRIASFVGFVPAEDPRMVLLVILDEPETGVSGGIVAAPVFQIIARGTLRHLGAVPQRAVAEPPARPVPATLVRVREKATKVLNFRGSGGFPDFTGLSLREAVGRAHTLKLRVKVQGHGYVIGQAPPPGARLQEGETVTVTLRDP